MLSNSSIRAVYFHGDGCEHCEKVTPALLSLQEKYPDLRLEIREVYHNSTNQQLFVAMSRQHNISSPGIPLLFIGSSVLSGDREILLHTEDRILAERERIVSCNTTPTAPPPPDLSGCPASVPSLTPAMVLVPALVDSLNPCALSVLIFLLITIAAAENRRRMLLIGCSYIIAVFLFHLLMGIGIFSVVSLSGYSRAFSLAGAAIAILFGVITLSDLLRKKETFSLSVPESGKGLLSRYARAASVPAAFVLGILAGLLGFSCTGGIYISILALMGTSMTLWTGLPYLVLYNIIFVLPLVLVTLLVAYGIRPETAEKWKAGHNRAFRLIIGMVMIAVGLVIVLGWIG